jgi:hypothetical protein
VVREGEISNLKGLNELKRARLQDPTLGNDLQLKAEFAEILLLASVDGEMRMPGSTPPTSQLDWLSSTTAMIVLLWSRATRDLLKSFGWGIATHHRLHAATKLPPPRRPPHRIFRYSVANRRWVRAGPCGVFTCGGQEDLEKRADPPHPARWVYSCQESSAEPDMLGRQTEERALTPTEIVALAKQSGSP